MWGQVAGPNGFCVMACDVPAHTAWEAGVIPFFLSVRGADADEVTGYWNALAKGAVIKAPLAPSGHAILHGMLTDRFGVTSVLDVMAPYTPA